MAKKPQTENTQIEVKGLKLGSEGVRDKKNQREEEDLKLGDEAI